MKCLEHLKENNIGRATFISLDKMIQHQPQRIQSFSSPPNAQRLYDLVVPKEDKFENAFYYALKDTLVVNDIKTATTI